MTAVAVALYAVVRPLSACRYPPMTDLPFHAAQTSTFRHYLDPSFHLKEQFELHPLGVPYMSMYAIGAVLMLVLPALTATKIAAGVMLALLPAGLAVMFHGMKKSPLLGLLGLSMCWGSLTHWGFLNYVAALGLFAMELQRRSVAGGWGIQSNLSHPGISPTNLLAAQPEMGRPRDTMAVRSIRAMSRLGLLFGTPESAALPAVYAATRPDAGGGLFYGPKGFNHLGGAPAEEPLYSRMASAEDARRMWELSERLVGVGFPE